MYHFSRSIYRELAPRVVEDEADPTGCANKQKVLDACEAAIFRLTTDRHYFARPARWLFNEIRPYFGLADQLYAWTVVETSINLAVTFLDRLPAGAGVNGSPPRCRALTRKGTASGGVRPARAPGRTKGVLAGLALAAAVAAAVLVARSVLKQPVAAPAGFKRIDADIAVPGAKGPETHVYGSMALHLYMRER